MRSIDRVRDFLEQHNVATRVQELDASTRTAQLAAAAVGAPVGSIVKSLVWITDDDRAVLALIAGDQRADAAQIAQCVNAAHARLASAVETRERTGYAIGGVPPVAHDRAIETLIDQTLLRFERVWAAAGAPNAVFEIETRVLVELTRGQVSEIVSHVT